MRYIQYNNADDFLKRMKNIFESTESVNGLMFGLCLKLRKNLFQYGDQPLFALVENDSKIIIAALMTPPHKLQLCAPDGFSEDSIDVLIQGLISNGWKIPEVMADKNIAETFSQKWKEIHNCKTCEGMKQRIHELKSVQPIKQVPGEFKQATPKDMEILFTWERAFIIDCFGETENTVASFFMEDKVNEGLVFLWTDPYPVSMAARTRPTPNGESVSLVYTPPEKRNHGYATSLVAALSQRILDDGKDFCCLYTDLSNLISNSIYRDIGYVPMADVIDIHFEY